MRSGIFFADAREGAWTLLQNTPRPAILTEVEDIRKRPWDYPARGIMQLLARWNHRWLALGETGSRCPASPDDESYDSNDVVLPDERPEEFQRLLGEPQGRQFQRAHQLVDTKK